MIQKPLDAIKALVVSFDPNESKFSLSLQEKELYSSGSLTQSLTDVFTTLGEATYKSDTPICFFIDEIANIANVMKKSVTSISTSRAQLINKGITYSVKYKELDFTVQEFDGFIMRLNEYKEWKKEKR